MNVDELTSSLSRRARLDASGSSSSSPRWGRALDEASSRPWTPSRRERRREAPPGRGRGFREAAFARDDGGARERREGAGVGAGAREGAVRRADAESREDERSPRGRGRGSLGSAMQRNFAVADGFDRASFDPKARVWIFQR